MDSRTCLEGLINISEQLKTFSIAELFYALQEHGRLSLFDINRPTIRQKNPKFVEIDLIECQKPNDDDDDDDNDENEDKDDD
ncbi:unnamed protein product [Rotaria sp. Silwood2]|nr:unnamed protein product [Rotaria sp. Silwood2]CAF4532706.1 unnamed protein product [Rotaria sp. Silwood2]